VNDGEQLKMPTRAETRRRVEEMRADRCRGLTYRQIAAVHRCDVALAFRAARHVDIAHLWRKWHLARLCKPEAAPLAVHPAVHQHRVAQW
jgi:hypothetical protein